ncbi:unnamed protein product [Linum trigynum]|uniref:DUF4283 domain-containing protein n=1 Tax=Linum trigynum TaxID=586398 RepID=A0AAV2FK96_9ROSI
MGNFTEDNLNNIHPKPEDFCEMELWIRVIDMPSAYRNKGMVEKIAGKYGRFLLLGEWNSGIWSVSCA